MWKRTTLVLELAVLATAAVAAVLTAGTVIHSNAALTPLTDSQDAALAWILCACLAGAGVAAQRWLPAEGVTRLKRPLMLLLTTALIWMLLGALRPTFKAGDGLFGEYFPNVTWTGPSAISISDTDVSAARMRERWNNRPPEEFSVRWTGFLTVGRPGLYGFSVSSDDGSQLFVDNQLVVDNGGMHSLETRSGSIRLTPGPHTVVLRYVQFGAASTLEWSWSRDGGEFSAIPSWILSRRPARYGTVLSVRIVDWALWSFAILAGFETAWLLGAGLRQEPVRAWTAERRRAVTTSYPNTAALVFSLSVYTAIMLSHWPAGTGQRFSTSIGATIKDVHYVVVTSLRHFGAFQAEINTPQAGEYVLPATVREILMMIRSRGLERYQLSGSIAVDAWVYQQTVASAWPRKLEGDAKVRFILNTDPVTPGCTVIEEQKEVSLVYCP